MPNNEREQFSKMTRRNFLIGGSFAALAAGLGIGIGLNSRNGNKPEQAAAAFGKTPQPENTPTNSPTTAPATSTSITSAPIPTRPSRETATPIPTVDKIPLDQLPTKIDNLKTTVTSYGTPFNPRISPEQFKQDKDNVLFITNKTQEAFKSGNAEEGRKWLVELKSAIFHMGDILQAKNVPAEIKKVHDPKDKYIKDDPVDPRLMEPYLIPVDLLVTTDNNY